MAHTGQMPADRITAANDELIVKGNAGAAAEYFAPDYVVHIGDQDRRGLHSIKTFLTQIRKSFDDLQVDVRILADDGTRVAWQRTLRATHKGAFRGFPATDRPITWHDMIVTRFEDGLIAEEWAVSDLAERMLEARH